MFAHRTISSLSIRNPGDPHNFRIVEVNELDFEDMDCSEDSRDPSDSSEPEGKLASFVYNPNLV